MRKIMRKILKYTFFALLIFLFGFFIYFIQTVKMSDPKIADTLSLLAKRQKISENFYGIKNNRFRKSESGLWELYIEGTAFERGVYNGKLTKELVKKQEDAFVEELQKIIPSASYLKFLKYFVGWFNRDMEKYIPQEYLHEIYGISKSAAKEYEYIGSNYQRILNYHGAHDIGHALQNLAMVGCTSFSTKNELNENTSLITGRNFDFYVGDKFAEDKIVTFYNPEKGHKFAMITWGAFVGVVSGMNIKGLAITINAGKSEIPMSAKTPVSLLAREILQYAENIEQAYKIAEKRQTFVAEAIMISSLSDNKTAIIEKTPYKISLFTNEKNYIIGPNHFQSNDFDDDELNNLNKKESSSLYRYEKILELLDENPKMNYLKAAKILRNQSGLKNKKIGLTNEKNICQLISHHSIIFKPNELKFWISTNPFQLGKYVCYDLDSVFAKFPGLEKNTEIYEQEFTIPADSFLYSEQYLNFLKFKKLKKKIKFEIKNEENKTGNQKLIDNFINSNPDYFYTFTLVGDYFYSKGKFRKAEKYYKKALTKEISTVPEKIYIEKQLGKINFEQ